MASSNLLIYKNVPQVEDETICPVCTDKAPPGEVHHPHYGAISCYSCRAFFRRANQKTKKPNYICKRDGNCTIFPKCKQHCKRCRLDKCIAVGMNPKWVLSDSEKRVRFKNYFKKRDEMIQAGIKPTKNIGSTSRRKRKPPVKKELLNTSSEPEEATPAKRGLLSPESWSPGDWTNSNPATPTKPQSSPALSSASTFVVKTEPKTEPDLTNAIPVSCESRPRRISRLWIKDESRSHEFRHQRGVYPQARPCQSIPHLGADCYHAEGSQNYPFQNGMGYHNNCDQDYGQFYSAGNWYNQQINGTYFGRRSCGQTPVHDVMTNRDYSNFAENFYESVRNQNLFETILYDRYMREANFPPQNIVVNAAQMNWNNQVYVKPEPEPEEESDDSIEIVPRQERRQNQEVENQQQQALRTIRNEFLSMRFQLSNVLEAFTYVATKLTLRATQCKELILNHQRQHPIHSSTLMTQLSAIAAALTEYASTQFLFNSLTPNDKQALLRNNVPLYLQYVLARYFSAESGLEQLNWILEGQLNLDSIEIVTNLSRISLREYNASTNFFPNAETLEVYSHHVDSVGMFYQFPQNCNGLIVNMLLYRTDEAIVDQLEEPQRIRCIYDEAKRLVQIGNDFLDRRLDMNPASNIGALVHTLTKMQKIFGDCSVQNSSRNVNVAVPHSFELHYTRTEDNWMRLRLSEFQDAFRSVAPPGDFFKNLIDLLERGRQAPDCFVFQWMGMIKERSLRVLKTHSEFNNLPTSEQELIWGKNQANAIALAVVRINMISTGKGQLKNILGVLNEEPWEEEFRDQLDLEKLKPYYIRQREVHCYKLDETSTQCMDALLKDLGQMCSNDKVYQLFTLLSLLDIEDLPQTPSMLKVFCIRQTYLRIFQRKLVAAGCSYVDYAKFRQTLKKVKVLANLMDNFND